MSDPTKLSAADQAAHNLSLARAFGETSEHLGMLPDAQPAAEEPQEPAFGADGDLGYADVYGGGGLPAPKAAAPAAPQHTGEVYAMRYGSYNFPKPSGQ